MPHPSNGKPLPVTTEAIEKNADHRSSWKAEDNKIIIEFDLPSDN